MNFIQNERPENSPYLQLLMLLFYGIIGLLLSMVIGFVIIVLIYGPSVLTDLTWLSASDPAYITAYRIVISAQQIGLFMAPALFLAITEGKKLKVFYGFKTPKSNLLLLVILLMICTMPAIEWVMVMNQKMILPPFLKGVEQWMKDSEESAAVMTTLLLKMDNAGTFILNLAMIGLLPAIAEEFIFRGAIQRSFGRMFKNPHLGIWIAAFLFSAIHMQFYGFFPRLLLGAGFGYIYYWTGSLWYAMFAHFINNAYAVTAAWYMQKNNIPLSEADKTTNFAWYGYLISIVLTFLLFSYFKSKAAIVPAPELRENQETENQ